MNHEDYKDYKHEDLFNLFFKKDSKFQKFMKEYNDNPGLVKIDLIDSKWKLNRKGFEKALEKYVKMVNEEEYEEKVNEKDGEKGDKENVGNGAVAGLK